MNKPINIPTVAVSAEALRQVLVKQPAQDVLTEHQIKSESWHQANDRAALALQVATQDKVGGV